MAGCDGPGWAISSASRPCSRSTGRKGPLWRAREDYALSLLISEVLPIWHAARDKAEQDGAADDVMALSLRGGHEGRGRPEVRL